MMQGDPADKPRVKAQAYSDEQMEEHKAKDRWGLPSSFIGIAMSAVVIIVQHALCLAVTLGVGGIFALEELELELELELIQYQMTQKPMLRCEVGARSLRASSHA